MKRFLPVMVLTGLLLQTNSYCWSQQAIISKDAVEIYDLPMFGGNLLAMLAKGDTVRVIGQRGNWVKIVYDGNLRGWMPIDIKKPVEPGSPVGNASAGFASSAIKPEEQQESVKLASAANPDRLVFDPEPDVDTREPLPPTPVFGPTEPGRFGYSFGAGMLESDFAYQWRFVYHTTPNFTMEGSFKHILGEAADSYMMLTNFSYFFGREAKTLPYLTAGMGVITTVPERSIDLDSVSHMLLNYGFGLRRYIHRSISVTVGISQYSVFVETETKYFREFSIGFLVGRFWN